jgi:hypothetical protein
MTPLSEAWAALAELRKATLGFQQARTANPNAWLDTHNSKCEQHLVATINLLGGKAKITPKPTPPPTPPPPPAVDLSPVRNLLVFATVSDDALSEALTLPARWKFLFSADPVYRPTQLQVNTVRNAGRQVYAWSDCRTTMPIESKAMVRSFALDGWYGQGENAGEFDVCAAAGGTRAIVNVSALNGTQLAAVANARILVTNENYRNVNPETKPDWRNANAGIGGNCGAVYGSASEGAVYTSVKSQLMNGWFGVNDSWYCEGFLPADWQALRDLG